MLSGCVDESEKKLKITPVSYKELPGWESEDFDLFWSTFQESCKKINKSIYDPIDHLPISKKSWKYVCNKVVNFNEKNSDAQRKFIVDNFIPHKVIYNNESNGLFTGYFQPILKASRKKTNIYKYPIYSKPDDLVIVEDLRIFNPKLKGNRIAGRVNNGRLIPFDKRAEIENGSLKNKAKELSWVNDPVKLFFMHIQGSGVLSFEDGSEEYLSYAATNGHRYTAIGKILIDQGEITKEKMSMQALESWLKKNPERIEEILNQNESYVFFIKSINKGVFGSQGTKLTPLRSIAVDRNYVPLGTLLWLDIDHPIDKKRIQRLVIAQDVGGAIKGPIRGDIFWGKGNAAGENAGVMKSKGTYYMLLPKGDHCD